MFKALRKTSTLSALKTLVQQTNALSVLPQYGFAEKVFNYDKKHVDRILSQITPIRKQLLKHPLYNGIKHINHLKVFMEHHIYAVWDFMSLLKALQLKYANNQVPWVPMENTDIRKFLNEIAMGEETDSYQLNNSNEQHSSHYDLYVQGMQEVGANVMPIQNLLIKMKGTKSPTEVIRSLNLPDSVKEFLGYNFGIIEEGKIWKIGSCFTFGREEIIPDMFKNVVGGLQKNFPESKLDTVIYYFNRHIQIDGDEHGPMSLMLMTHLCGNDQKKWDEVEEVAVTSLKKREVLWEGIWKDIQNCKV